MAADTTVSLHPRATGQQLEPETWPARETCLLICDVWDKHWCPAASARVDELAPAVDRTAKAARAAGMLVIHGPSNCMPFYAGTRARENARNAPAATPPVELVTTQRFGTAWVWPDADSEPPLPIDDSDGGCDCDAGDTPVDACVWTQQHPAIEICDGDAVSECGGEVYNLLRSRGVKTVLICGVHLNMCVLGRGFAIGHAKGLHAGIG